MPEAASPEAPSLLRPLAVLAVICVVLIVAATLLTRGGGTRAAAAPLILGDVSDAQLVEIRNPSGVAVVSGEFRSRVDLLGNTEKDAALIGRDGRTVIGEVELELPASGRDDRRPELEVDIIGLAPRQAFTVVIDDRPVGSFTTDDRGSIDEELQEGETAQ